MKRIVISLAGLATLGTVIYLGSNLLAQQPSGQAPAAQPPLQTRVALINLGEVIKNYTKFKNFELTLKEEANGYQKQFETLRSQAAAKDEQAKNPQGTPQQREEAQRELKNIQRQMQDMGDEAKQKLGKEEFEVMVQMYKEVEEAVTAYAKAYAIELVLQYNDPIGPERFSPPIFQRKLANGACMPIYHDSRMDISAVVTEMLNKRLAQMTNSSGHGSTN